MIEQPVLVVFHPMDPRGTKLGGIETHVRLILAHHPPGVTALLVGIDEIGDLALGRAIPLGYQGREIVFLPVLRAEAAGVNVAARSVVRSLTLRYALSALRRRRAVRRAIGGAPASCEIGRFEFAVLPRSVRRPTVLTIHNEGRREDAMDSLLKRWWWLHRFNERVALRLADAVFAVNEAIAARAAALDRGAAAKTQVLSVAVDTRRFRPSPFEAEGETLRVCYAGRLDAFKDPALMFATLALVAERLAAAPAGRFRRLGFVYAGASDPAAVPGHERLDGIIERRGILGPDGVAALMRDSHLGLITSIFEGLPCYLLEMLASGRPVVARALPQFAALIADGVSGRLVPSRARPATLADAVIAIACDISGGRLDPRAIAAKAAPHSVDAQMERFFRVHDAIAHRRPRAGSAAADVSGS